MRQPNKQKLEIYLQYVSLGELCPVWGRMARTASRMCYLGVLMCLLCSLMPQEKACLKQRQKPIQTTRRIGVIIHHREHSNSLISVKGIGWR